MVGSLAVGLEVAYSQIGQALPTMITILNWASFILIIFITFFHTRCSVLHLFVCPILTCLAMLYISFVDYDVTLQSIYYS